jgi:hypothetical protein
MMGDFDGWMPREKWDALVRGEGCPLCVEVASSGADTGEGLVVGTSTLH